LSLYTNNEIKIITGNPENSGFESYRLNSIAKQAHGSAWLQSGDTVLLATVVMDEMAPADEDFLPLTVQYVEKSYSIGKIPAGFFKREGKPSDFETLTSRVVDRAIRPLFPKGFNYPVQVSIFTLSVDEDADLQILAMKSASAALFASNIPVKKSVSAVRIGKIDNNLVINPKADQKAKSTLDLFVAGTSSELLMIEMRAIGTTELVNEETKETFRDLNGLTEPELIDALSLAETEIKKINSTYEEKFEEFVREKREVELFKKEFPQELINLINENYSDAIRDSLSQLAKSERAMILINLSKQIFVENSEKESFSEEWNEKLILEIVELRKREIMRSTVLKDRVRADGRKTTEVRPIAIETNILPRVHGSVLFTRGQTQALVTLTIGTTEDAQVFEELSDGTAQLESFMVHYNFPGFSVGEASRLKGVGRRELGHGNLAKRALEPSLKEQDGLTVRLVSEILESNGSSSMATVCGGSLALKAGGQPADELIAGVAMGLILDDETGEYAVLTDIMGLEDHDGDMDFKVAGTRNQITALQMDIKLGGVPVQILTEALQQARDARSHILGIMEEASESIVINEENLPKIENFKVAPKKVVEILGQAGKTIKSIIEKFDVKIDIERETGDIKVIGRKSDNVKNAVEFIKNLVSEPADIYKAGMKFKGSVKEIVQFGAFMNLPMGGDGLLHISKVSRGRVNKVEDVLSVGDEVELEIVAIKGHKIELKRTDI
jgi:polyribonucleotide nucleotidyltransferase